MNILLVDDEFFFQMTMSFFLNELNHHVTLASDGEKALELIKNKHDFDLLICDINMPVLPGETFLKEFRVVYKGKMPVVVVVSGMNNGPEFLKKLNVPFDYYCQKPMDVNVFIKTLDEIVSSRK